MAIRKFMTSVADVYAYDTQTGDLILYGKTLLDTSLDTTLGNTDVRAGRGAPLQYVYYHSPDLKFTVNDAQFNLAFLAANVGSVITTGNNVYTEENVTLTGGGAGTVTGTPLAVTGTTVYGWVTLVNGDVEKVTFTGSAFTCSGTSGDVVCVRYYLADAASRSITVSGSIVPSILRFVLEAQLASSDVTSNVIGKVQIEVPRATLTGAFSLAMKPDSVASTPLNARALPNNDTVGGCVTQPWLAKITEVITGTNWYDNVIGLSIAGGDFALTHPATKQLQVYAIPSTGAAFIPPTADLTFASSDTGKATVNASGLVTTVAAGSSTIHVTITAKPAYDASVVVTVS